MQSEATCVVQIHAIGAFRAGNWLREAPETQNTTIGQPVERRYVPGSRENTSRDLSLVRFRHLGQDHFSYQSPAEDDNLDCS